MKFDVVIVSKDRYPLLLKQVKRIKNNIRYQKIIIVDSTDEIPKQIHKFYTNEGIEYYHTPNVKLGYARQLALEAVSTPFFLMLDDDIIFKRGLAETLYNEMLKYGPTVFAMSPIIIFGSNKDIIPVMLRHQGDSESASSGCVMFITKIALGVGGFNPEIHIGEDAELFYRAIYHKYRWIRKDGVFVNHPLTDVEFIFRKWRHREGISSSVAYGYHTYHGLIIIKIKGMLINLLSFMKYRNFRTLMFCTCHDFITVLAYIRGIIGGKEYALHKTKIV